MRSSKSWWRLKLDQRKFWDVLRVMKFVRYAQRVSDEQADQATLYPILNPILKIHVAPVWSGDWSAIKSSGEHPFGSS